MQRHMFSVVAWLVIAGAHASALNPLPAAIAGMAAGAPAMLSSTQLNALSPANPDSWRAVLGLALHYHHGIWENGAHNLE